MSLWYLLIAIGYQHLWHRGRQGFIAMHSQPSPPFTANQAQEIANCSTFSGWPADHLLAIKW